MVVADKGARVGNVIVDTALVFLLIGFLGLVLDAFTNVGASMWSVYAGVSYVAYYFLFEYFLGKTPGKYLTRTRVVNLKGCKPGVKRILIRSLARLIFYDYFSFIFGQGLHDSISRTLVVSGKHNAE